MIEVITRPEREQINNASLISRWNAARQPNVFKLQRRDYTVISCNSDGFGSVVVKCDYDAALPAEILADDLVYFASELNADGVPDYYGVVGTVVSVATTVGVEHLIYTTYPIEALSTGAGYLNVVKRANYYLGISVNVTDPNTLITHEIPCKLKGGIDGNMRLDASEFITAYLLKQPSDDYSFINKLDRNVYGKFSIVFHEYWTGSSNVDVGDIYEYYFVDSVKQIGEDYGQNLCDQLMFAQEFTPLAKWLTDFDSPTYFDGYPFDISFIYPVEMGVEVLRRNEIERTFGGGSLSSIQTNLDADQVGGVNRLTITGTYTAGTAYIDLGIDFNDGVDNIPLMEDISIKIGSVCPRNPVYLAWRNSRGGWNYWLFSGNQSIGYSSKQVGEISNANEDRIENIDHRSKALRLEQVKRIICGANILIEDLEGLRSIEASPAVYLFTGTSSYTWKRVKVIPKGFQYQTRGVNSDVTVEIELPELYTVSN